MPMTARRTSLVAVAVAVAAAAAVVATLAPVPAGAAAISTHEIYAVPPNGVFSLHGHGYGHGHGMSQFGAYGAAIDGRSMAQIVAFYYPHTTLTATSSWNPTLHVLLSALRDTASGYSYTPGYVAFLPATAPATLTVTSQNGSKLTLPPKSATVQRFGLQLASGGTLALREYDGSRWTTVPGWTGVTAPAHVTGSSGVVSLVTPAGATRSYRGTTTATVQTANGAPRLYVVDDVPMESYLRSVVPSEMPSDWTSNGGAALQSQAVAARTYASYGHAHPRDTWYDVFDDTRDQAYTGTASEASSTNAAVAATAGRVVHDANGNLAFTQFSSSDGGWTTDGGEPYLVAQQDPYDGVPTVSWNPHSWTASVTAAAIQRAYPAVGTLQQIIVTGRDGNGEWGGRVTTIQLNGTAGQTVNTTGIAFRSAFGLKSEWFKPLVPPSAPRYVRASFSGGTLPVSWVAPATYGGSALTGYRLTLLPNGTSKTVSGSTLSSSFTGLAASNGYRVQVQALNANGASPAVTVTTKVFRTMTSTPGSNAVTRSRAAYPNASASTVVLLRASSYTDALPAVSLAARRHGPLLVLDGTAMSSATEAELRRVLPAHRTVYLVGSTTVIPAAVASRLTALGYTPVRVTASDRWKAAVAVARTVPSPTWIAEVDGNAVGDGYAVASPVARNGGVVVYTNGTSQSADTAAWIAQHSTLPRYAIGSAAAAADPAATKVVGGAKYTGTAVAVAQRWFPSTTSAVVVDAPDAADAMTAALLLARAAAPVLLSGSTALSADPAAWIRTNASRLTRVWVAGPDSALRYYNAESDIHAALLS